MMYPIQYLQNGGHYGGSQSAQPQASPQGSLVGAQFHVMKPYSSSGTYGAYGSAHSASMMSNGYAPTSHSSSSKPPGAPAGTVMVPTMRAGPGVSAERPKSPVSATHAASRLHPHASPVSAPLEPRLVPTAGANAGGGDGGAAESPKVHASGLPLVPSAGGGASSRAAIGDFYRSAGSAGPIFGHATASASVSPGSARDVGAAPSSSGGWPTGGSYVGSDLARSPLYSSERQAVARGREGGWEFNGGGGGGGGGSINGDGSMDGLHLRVSGERSAQMLPALDALVLVRTRAASVCVCVCVCVFHARTSLSASDAWCYPCHAHASPPLPPPSL